MTEREHSPEFAAFVAVRYRDLLRTAFLLTGATSGPSTEPCGGSRPTTTSASIRP